MALLVHDRGAARPQGVRDAAAARGHRADAVRPLRHVEPVQADLVGALARLVGKAASSPALQSTVASFAEYETTIDSTSEMLKKCQRGLADVDELLDGMSEASTRAARPGG